MAQNKYSGMSLEEVEKIGFELILKLESMGDDPHPLEVVKVQRDLMDATEMVYSLQNNIPIENIENRFYKVPVDDIVTRYNELLEELENMDDEIPSSVFADKYREFADCLEMIGELEENTEG